MMSPLPLVPDSSLSLLADLIKDRTGLQYESRQLDLLVDRLAPLLAEGGFQTYLDYFYYLKYDDQAASEWLRVQTALAINETYFWREYGQIQAVAQEIVPRLQREKPGAPVRIWHAASASGEEPYTMAIALNEAGCFDHGPIEIIGTDFNSAALSQARQAVYRPRSFRSIPADILERYFVPQSTGLFRLVDPIRSRVSFAYSNLMDESSMQAMRGYDVIFCRNAFIYFSHEAVNQVVGRFYKALNPAGYLFVAAAESLLRLNSAFTLLEIGQAFGYQKPQASSSTDNSIRPRRGANRTANRGQMTSEPDRSSPRRLETGPDDPSTEET